MDNKAINALRDIVESIDNIDLFCRSHGREYQNFCEDKCFRSAVQWEISIIGEAMNRVLKTEPDIPITSARKIVNTRNFLIHGYDSLRADLIWSIVIKHLPVLKSEVAEILNSVSDQDSMNY